MIPASNSIDGLYGNALTSLFGPTSFDVRLAEVSNYFQALHFDGIIGVIKIISACVSLLLFLIWIWVVLKSRELHLPKEDTPSLMDELNPPQPAIGGAMTARWEEIMRHLDSAKEAEWKFGIIEADKLVEDVLRRAGFPGATLGERLMNIQDGQLASLDGLWSSHKVRNRIAHDLNYFLRYSEAKQAIDYYAAVLRELNLI